MGNISADYDCAQSLSPDEDTDFRWLYCQTSATIYKGSLLEYEYSGGLTGLVKFNEDTSSSVFAGVAAETVASATALQRIKVWIKGDFEFTKTTPAVTDIGTEFYAGSDPSVVDSSGNVKVGMCVDYKSTKLVISIDGYAY